MRQLRQQNQTKVNLPKVNINRVALYDRPVEQFKRDVAAYESYRPAKRMAVEVEPTETLSLFRPPTGRISDDSDGDELPLLSPRLAAKNQDRKTHSVLESGLNTKLKHKVGLKCHQVNSLQASYSTEYLQTEPSPRIPFVTGTSSSSHRKSRAHNKQ